METFLWIAIVVISVVGGIVCWKVERACRAVDAETRREAAHKAFMEECQRAYEESVRREELMRIVNEPVHIEAETFEIERHTEIIMGEKSFVVRSFTTRKKVS